MAHLAQARALGAGTVGVVEREHPGRDLFQADVAGVAGEILGKDDLFTPNFFLPALRIDPGRQLDMGQSQPAGKLQRHLQRIGQAPAQAGPDHEAVKHHVDRVLDVFFHLDLLVQLAHRAVDTHPDVTGLAEVLEQLDELALASAHDRCHHDQAASLRIAQQAVHHLVDRLALDLPAALGAVRRTDAGKKQPQVVVDFRDGADCRTRVAAGRLLVDRNRRRQAVDMVDVRFLHLAEKLAGIRRQRFDIASLTLGIDGVEGQRRFA